MGRPTQATLNLAALRHNADHVRELAPHAKLMAVVKANAYGHGASSVAGALAAQVDAFAVACLEEALELRRAGIDRPILLLEGVFEPDELHEASAQNLWLTVANEDQLRWLEQADITQNVTCWLKVNTGMNRLGVDPVAAVACFERLSACTGVTSNTVVYTHFANADNLSSQRTAKQVEALKSLSLDAPRSAANSAGIIAWPESHLDWVRPGYMLYGNSPLGAAHPNSKSLRPVMTLSSHIIALREVATGTAVGYGGTFVTRRPSKIATVAIGYGDGYPRQAVNGTPILINRQRAALAGRVSMDMITVDVTDIQGVALGQEAILWGESLPVDEVASHAGTIGYELIARMPARTPRVIASSADGR